MIKRLFDLVVALAVLLVLALPLLAIALAIRWTSPGPALYWSQRSGRGDRLFSMPKLRSMRGDTPELATELLADPQSYITPLGYWLRKTSVDELPQLWSVLCGDMSLVGPRPVLQTEEDLRSSRLQLGVDQLRPGITGWAQVNGRDDIPLRDKIALDHEYLLKQGLAFDLKIIAMTVMQVWRGSGVKH